MRINFKHFLSLLFALFVQIAVAQEITVTGVVTDQAGIPIPGANVLVKGTKSTTQTDFSGVFAIKATPGDVLVVSFVDMSTVEVSASSKVTVRLKDASNLLENVVVVGYGTQSKRKMTDATVGVKAKDIQNIPVSNIQSALVGKLAGVQITQTNGKVEGGINIRVRGQASISAGAFNNPITTEIVPIAPFYVAEDYHQNYYNQNGNQPYCSFVIRPKLEKFHKVFQDKIKKGL